MKVKMHMDRPATDGERRNAEKIIRNVGVDFQQQILQATRDRVYHNFVSGYWTSSSAYNEALVVPLGEGNRIEQYLSRLSLYIGQEFSTVGYTDKKYIGDKCNVSIGFVGNLRSVLESAFSSVHILSTLRIVYQKDREMKRGYVEGLREAGFGKKGDSTCVLALAEEASTWFGITTKKNTYSKEPNEKFLKGFEGGKKDVTSGKYESDIKKIT